MSFNIKKLLTNAALAGTLGALVLSNGQDGLSKQKREQFIHAQQIQQTKLLSDPNRLIPSYEKTLEQVVMNAVPNVFMQSSLIESLPSYSEIIFLTSDDFEKSVTAELADIPLGTRRMTLLTYPGEGNDAKYVWAQDIGEMLTTPLKSKLIIPRYYFTKDGSATFKTDSFLKFLKDAGFAAEDVNAYFSGGNLTYDVLNGKKILFVGDGNLSLGSDDTNNNKIERKDALDAMKQTFGVDEIVVLGTDQNYTTLFHIDQMFVITGPGEVAVMNLELAGNPDIKQAVLDLRDQYLYEKTYADKGQPSDEFNFFEKFYPKLNDEKVQQDLMSMVLVSKFMLEDAKTKFANLGYKIHTLPINLMQLFHYQSYANSVIYKDKLDGKRKALVPLYPDENGSYNTKYYPNAEAIDFFQKLGLEVTGVPNYTWILQGNVNCLMNVVK